MMAGAILGAADTGAVVAVEVFVEPDEFAPMVVGGEF